MSRTSKRWCVVGMLLVAIGVTASARAAGGTQAERPPMPGDIPAWLVGDPQISGERLQAWEATFSMGAAAKEGPLGFGEKIEARAKQTMKLERTDYEGVAALLLSRVTRRADTMEVVAESRVYVEEATLRPLLGRVEQGGQVTEFTYDWDEWVVRESPAPMDPSVPAEVPVDLAMLEAGAHEIWMAALDYDEDFAVRIPAILAGGGGFKFWAVPRVIGSEMIDLGDGHSRDAWVVALDWWGMGKNTDFYPGEGANGTAGSGGTYWVLKQPPAGVPPVVRVRTERDSSTDSVIQMQDGLS